MATKQKRVNKAERKRFITQAVKLIEQQGGQPVETSGFGTEFKMNSKFGPLRLSVYERACNAGGPGDVMARFEFARLAASALDCNPYSGKWNHHYFAPWAVDEALTDIQRWLSIVQYTPLEAFADQTSIVPGVIATTVISERCKRGTELCDPPYAFAGGNGLSHDESARWFVQHVEARTIFLFDSNSCIHQVLLSEAGRDTLCAFINHWLDAYTHDLPGYRTKNSLL